LNESTAQEAMMKFQKNFDSCDRPASGSTTELMQATDTLARFHRVSWKEAFARMASPALRLHRYRHAHNRLLQRALCELDCSDTGDRNA